MRPSVTGSGQKSGRDRDHTSSSRPLPSIDPYPPIYPEANGRSFPISPTEKLIEREPQFYERGIVRGPLIISSPQRQGEGLKKGAALPGDDDLTRELERLRAENTFLNNDRNRLIREYEEKLRALSLSGPGTSDIDELSRLRLKLADVEAANRNNSELYEQEKKTSESLRLLLKLKEGEQLPPANSVTDEVIRRMLIDYENKNVMFMIEIERLGRIVGELQMENDRLIAKLSQNDLKSSLQTIDTDKYLLQNQIRDYKIRLEELEHQLLVTRQDLDRSRSGQQGGTGANSALIMEIERINSQLRERDLRIKDLEEGLRVRSSGEQVKRSVLPDEGIRGEYEAGIESLTRENEALKERYKRLESAKLSEVQNIVNQNSVLSKQNILLTNENEKVIKALRELESEQNRVGSKFHQMLNELEEIERKKLLLINAEETPKTIALKTELTTKIQNGNYESQGVTQPYGNYNPSALTSEYQPSYTQTQYKY